MREEGPLDVRRVRECIEMATVDAYGPEERVTGWLTCFEEVFAGATTAHLLGQEVRVRGFDLADDTTIVVRCSRGRKTASVSIESIEWPKLTRMQTLWLRAWRQWRRGS